MSTTTPSSTPAYEASSSASSSAPPAPHCNCSDAGVPSSRQSKFPMTGMNDAIQLVVRHAKAAHQGKIDQVQIINLLSDSTGSARISAGDIFSPINYPPFRASIMDGYAVRSNYEPGIYTVLPFDALAGPSSTSSNSSLLQRTVALDELTYITTGAAVPDFADAVIQVEKTESVSADDSKQTKIRLFESVRSGTNIRPIGCDIRKGEKLISIGDRLGPTEIALLVSVGVKELSVYRLPTVALFSTGDELVDVTKAQINDLGNIGMIFDSNRPMLIRALKDEGAIVKDMGIIKDQPNALKNIFESLLSESSDIDIILCSGGVSMGNADFIKDILKSLGAQIHFGRLNMKPGKPTTFATVQKKSGDKTSGTVLIFGLPGNPVSAMITFQLLVQPALRCFFGFDSFCDPSAYPSLPVRLLDELPRDAERPEYHRVRIYFDDQRKEWTAESTGNQMSSRLLSLKAVNGLVLVKAGSGAIPKGLVTHAYLTGPLTTQKSTHPRLDDETVKRAENHLKECKQKEPLKPVANPMQTALLSHPNSHTHAHSHADHQHHNHNHHRHEHDHHHSPQPETSAMGGVPAVTSSASSSSLPSFTLRVSVVTVSDRCFRHEAIDASGPAACSLLSTPAAFGADVSVSLSSTQILPDEQSLIEAALKSLSDASEDKAPHVIFTVGGTGFAPRDVTPEATRGVIEREASGLTVALLNESAKFHPLACLSRAIVGVRKRTIIVNLPGSPRAVKELLADGGILKQSLAHAVRLMLDEKLH